MGSAPRAQDGSCGPHFSLGCAQRNPPEELLLPLRGNSPSVAAAAVEKKGALCPNPAFGGFGQVRGVPTGDIGRLRQDTALGAVLVLAISMSLASGLRRKLTHSDARPLPTKTASLGFRGGPYFAESFSRWPATGNCETGMQNRFGLLLFYCLALRRSQYFRHQCSTGSSFRCRSLYCPGSA